MWRATAAAAVAAAAIVPQLQVAPQPFRERLDWITCEKLAELKYIKCAAYKQGQLRLQVRPGHSSCVTDVTGQWSRARPLVCWERLILGED